MTRLFPPVLYAALSLLFTWPLILELTTHLGALEGPGDPYLNLFILGWDLKTLAADPASVFNGRIFEAPIFHPARQTLAYSDHQIPQALAMLPVYLATGNIVLCYNGLLLASLAGSAWAMHVYARTITGSPWGAYAAGIAWGFWPYRFAQLAHLQLQALYLLPLAFLFLHRLIAGRRRRDAIGLGLTAGLQALTSVYLGVIGGIALAVAALALAVGVGGRARALVSRFALAGVVFALLVAPILWPYWQVQRREGFARNLYEASHHSARASSYVSVPAVNVVYGRSGVLDFPDHLENELFPGLVVVALALVGLLAARRQGSGPAALALLACVAAGVVLSFGPNGIRLLYAALHRFVFGFHAIRAPARFGILVAFGLAGLAAIGMARAGHGFSRAGSGSPNRLRQGYGGPPKLYAKAEGLPRIVRAVILAFMVVEYLNVPLAFAPAPPRETPVGQWLRRVEGPGAVLHLPLGTDVAETPYMLQALEHGRPIVNGYSGQRPPFYSALMETMSQFPSSEAIWTLKDLDVRFIVSPEPIVIGERPFVERAHLDNYIYELVWSPEMEARLAPPGGAAPPPPGPLPFAVGETAVYHVFWAGAGAKVPAGEARIAVEPFSRAGPHSRPVSIGDSAAFRFVATATTADWVARFFEARDRFETIATRELLPLAHERQLREGRRSLDRRLEYDHGRSTVRLGGGGADLTFRVPAATRDAITAFYYARTLPLTAGSELRIPVNDLGRTYTLHLRAIGVESIAYRSGRVDALRLEPRLLQRVQRRQPVALTAWLSLDARRIPLVVELSAGFGSLRIELVDYRVVESRNP
jgi:hypothetical protein